MDDKVQNPTNPVQVPQPTPPQPTANVAPPPPPPAKESEDNKKTIMWLVGGLVLVILVVGVIYLLLSSQSPKSKTIPTPSPRAAVQENLEQDLETVNVEDIEGEFTTVDADLQKL